MDEELIDTIAQEEKICSYLDIPIQHCNDKILKTMNRRGNKEYLDTLLPHLREKIPGLVLRTSLIAGLPGEGEAEFEELCEFLKKHRLERVGCFAFSPEDGTAAAKMDYPDKEVAEKRAEIVSELQSRIMDDYNDSLIGKTVEVLVEGYDRLAECQFGRTYADSPEIDGMVFFTSPTRIKAGNFVQVVIEETMDGNLVGSLAEDNA
jgi:ribosomal protein S12 methylthiotransferase